MEATDSLPPTGPAWTRPMDECPTYTCTLDSGHGGEHEDWTTTATTGEVWTWDADKVAEFHTAPTTPSRTVTR